MSLLIDEFRGVTPSVFETEADPVVVTRRHIEQFFTAAKAVPTGRARLLLHENREDELHEMVVALPFIPVNRFSRYPVNSL